MEAESDSIYDTAEDMAKRVTISSKTLYRIAKGDPSFPVLRIGGSVRFPRERVLRWFREREQGRSPRADAPARARARR